MEHTHPQRTGEETFYYIAIAVVFTAVIAGSVFLLSGGLN